MYQLIACLPDDIHYRCRVCAARDSGDDSYTSASKGVHMNASYLENYNMPEHLFNSSFSRISEIQISCERNYKAFLVLNEASCLFPIGLPVI